MRRILAMLAVLACLGMTGCALHVDHDKYIFSENALSSINKIESGMKVYITLPSDGSYADILGQGSGYKFLNALQRALTPYASSVVVGAEQGETLDAALENGKKADARYVFIPRISNWEHRKAAWSGRPSQVELDISVYDLTLSDKEPVFSKLLIAIGKRRTTFSQFPEELLPPLLRKFATDVYTRNMKIEAANEQRIVITSTPNGATVYAQPKGAWAGRATAYIFHAFPHGVYPEGDWIQLPGKTPLIYMFQSDIDIGQECYKAVLNGKESEIICKENEPGPVREVHLAFP